MQVDSADPAGRLLQAEHRRSTWTGTITFKSTDSRLILVELAMQAKEQLTAAMEELRSEPAEFWDGKN